MISPFLAAELEGRRAGAVALPTTEAEVVAIVGACARHGVPIVPRGAGTGTFGQALPMAGGWSPWSQNRRSLSCAATRPT